MSGKMRAKLRKLKAGRFFWEQLGEKCLMFESVGKVVLEW